MNDGMRMTLRMLGLKIEKKNVNVNICLYHL